MRTFCFLLLGLLLLQLAGCTEGDQITHEGDQITNNYTTIGDTTHWGTGTIRTLFPAATEIQQMVHQWTLHSNTSPHECPGYFSVDTIFSATVWANIPSGVHDAVVYVRQSPTSNFYASNLAAVISNDTILAPVFRGYANGNSFHADTMRLQFFVQVTGGDGTLWLGPISNYTVARTVEPGPALPPVAPEMDTLMSGSAYSPSFQVRFCQMSPWVDKAFVYYQSDFDGVVHIDSTNNYNLSALEIYNLLPAATYTVWTRAANAYGLSVPSDTLTAETIAPLPPTELTGSIVYPAPYAVYVQWQNRAECDSIAISRRPAAGEWSEIATFAGPSYYYSPGDFTDTTVVSGATYDYRIGARYPNGTWWSADSLHIAVP